MRKQDYPYKIPPVEQALNQLVKLIFYYRLVFVIAAILLIGIAAGNIYRSSGRDDQLKNTAVMSLFESVIIGIFYSILNYEHNQQRFRHDIKVSRETLTFNTSCKMYELQAGTIRLDRTGITNCDTIL